MLLFFTILGFIGFILLFCISACIVHQSPEDKRREDEEQMEFLRNYRKTHNKKL